MLDIEFYIHKAAISLNKGLDIVDIKALMPNINEDDFYLIIKAGEILANDWYESDIDEEPTKPDHKATPMPSKILKDL